MKTSVMINIGCDLASALCTSMETIGKMSGDLENENSTYLTVSHTCGAIRTMYEQLPESVKTNEFDAVISNLYPHKCEQEDGSYRWADIESFAYANHAQWFKLWQEMQDAKDKFGLSV